MTDKRNQISSQQSPILQQKVIDTQTNKNQNHSQRNKIKNANFNKISINLSDCQYPVLKLVAKGLGWKTSLETQTYDWDICWTDNAVLPETLFKMQQYQKINHFPGMYGLARKNLLGKGLMKMRKQFQQQYDFFPLTWLLPIEYSQLKQYYQSRPKGKTRTFIVKPQALSQGKGIFLTRKIQDIDPAGHFVVQRYMHKPYLIEGLKFDFRIYVLVAGVDPLRIYLYNEGLARFATQPYIIPTKQNMDDVCMHLTNYAINKDNPNFIFNKSQTDMSVGHKRSLSSVYDLLQKQGFNVKKLKDQINDIVIKTLISGSSLLTQNYRSCQPENYANNMCFEILGLDILLNSNGNPYLLEVNHTPSFTTDTPLDQFIKKNLIKDALVLMNINSKNKWQIINSKKQATNLRVITGKQNKLNQQQRTKLREQAQKQRDEFENSNLGGFEKIYPCNNQQKMKLYKQMITYNQKMYYQSTGISQKRREREKQISKAEIIKPPKPNIKIKSIIKSQIVQSSINEPQNKNTCQQDNTKINPTKKQGEHKKIDLARKTQQHQEKQNILPQQFQSATTTALPNLKIIVQQNAMTSISPMNISNQKACEMKIFQKKSFKNFIEVKKIKELSKCEIFYKKQQPEKTQQPKSIKQLNLNLFLSGENKINSINRSSQVSQSLEYKKKTPPLLTTLINHNYVNIQNKIPNVMTNLRQFLKY